MLSPHRGHINNDKPMTYQININGRLMQIDDKKSVILPDEYLKTHKERVLKWKRGTETSLSRLTPLSLIRRHMTYTEPQYMPWMKQRLNIHENQYYAARDIIEYFECGCNNVILAAEMQSGKTGTVRYVVHHLLHTSGPSDAWEERMQSDRIYFICGINDNDLRKQAVVEFKGLLSCDNIMFSKQLQKWNHDPPQYKRNRVSVVIIDESHYAGQTNSQVDKFLKSTRHCHPLILSVSATAMAEMAMSQHTDKGIAYLKPGPGYYGIKDLFDAGRIHQSVDITNKTTDFIDLVSNEYEMQRERDELKYNIVRLPSQWYYRDIEDELSDLDLDIDYINYHSQLAESEQQIDICDFNAVIHRKPQRFTIIWIYGTLRAGKQLNTHHIGFVHDTAHSSPDTIAQSLLGRILGYGKKRHMVTCYTDIKSARLIEKWFINMFDVTKIPKGSKAIINGYADKILKWELHPSIGVKLSNALTAEYRSLKQFHGHRYPYKWELFEDIIASADGNIQSELARIFSDYEVGPGGGLMVLTENNVARSFAEHWIGNYYNHLKGKPVRGFDVNDDHTGSYYYVYVNLNIKSLQYGYVLVTYKEYVGKNKGKTHILVNPKSRFSK